LNTSNEMNDQIIINDNNLSKSYLRKVIKSYLLGENLKGSIVQQTDRFYEELHNQVNFIHDIYDTPNFKNKFNTVDKVNKPSKFNPSNVYLI
jgi:hypothetical protein